MSLCQYTIFNNLQCCYNVARIYMYLVVVDTLLLKEDNHRQAGSQVLEDIHQVLEGTQLELVGGTHQELVGNQGQEGTLQLEDILVLEDNPNKNQK